MGRRTECAGRTATWTFQDTDFALLSNYYFSITAGLCFQYHDVFMIAFHLSRFHYIHVRWWAVSTGKHLFSFIIFLFLHVTGWGA